MFPLIIRSVPVGQDEKKAFVPAASVLCLSCFPFVEAGASVTEPLPASGRCAGFLMTSKLRLDSGRFAVNSDGFTSREMGWGGRAGWVGWVGFGWQTENLM